MESILLGVTLKINIGLFVILILSLGGSVFSSMSM